MAKPRRERADRFHGRTVVLALPTCAVIAGAKSWEPIAEYGRTKVVFLSRLFRLENSIPSSNSFGRVFVRAGSRSFVQAVGRWTVAECKATRLLSIADDGNPARAAKRIRPPAACTW